MILARSVKRSWEGRRPLNKKLDSDDFDPRRLTQHVVTTEECKCFRI